MAFITSYNTHKIITRNNFKNVNLSGQVYRFKLYMFSKYEENCLIAIQELMKNPENYFKHIYDPIVINDSKKYVYKEHQPAYHIDKDCKRLHSDFTNFELPEEIKERGDLEIERFRKWFSENQYLLETPDVFVMRLKLAFGISYNPKSIIYENSGFAEVKNYSVEELENKIDFHIKEAGRYFYAEEKNTKILRAFGKVSGRAFLDIPLEGNYTGYSEYEVKHFLKDYHRKYKLPIRKLLIEYYRIKFNPDLKFAENYMEVLGFKKCECCKRTEENRYFLNLSENDRWGFLLEKSQENKKQINNSAYQFEEVYDLPF
jgi:hypothetical protein